MCGAPLPSDQGSRTCSMCFGDPGHGKDGYYQNYLENFADGSEREPESYPEQE